MKSTLSSLDIHYLVKELQFLVDSRIDKVYEKDKTELLLNFYVPSKGKHLLKIVSGKHFYLTKLKEESDTPSGFCMQLRKHLKSARLRKFEQIDSERIIKLDFETKDKKVSLIIELFSNGNIILTNEENTIITASLFHKWKDRDIKPRIKYEHPKKEYNLFKIKDLTDLINSSQKENMVKTLAMDLGLGGEYAEELCKLANIDKNKKAKELKKEEIINLKNSLKELIKSNPKKISSEILDKNFSKIDTTPKENAKIRKIKNIIKEQEKKIKEYEKKEIEERAKGELIYAKYQLLTEILDEINKAKEKFSWKEIKAKLKGHKIIKEVNSKNKTIQIDLKP